MRKSVRALIVLPLIAVSSLVVAADATDDCGRLVPLAGIVDPALVPLPAEEQALPPGSQPVLDGCGYFIRPGSPMSSPAGCTMNWVFQDEHGALYIGTAGHCLGGTGSTGRAVSISGVGNIGTSVYTLNAGVGRDFGLVKIKPELYDRVDPTLCKWGGPNAMIGDSHPGTAGHHVILQYGFGLGYGTASATRARVFDGSFAHDFVDMKGPSAGGDSGSPLMTADGRAAGVLTHGMGVPVVNFGLGVTYGSKLDVALERAEAALGVDLTLVTSDVPVQLGAGVPFPDPAAA